jgi:thiol-disulfide isomerase/thioredoxin
LTLACGKAGAGASAPEEGHSLVGAPAPDFEIEAQSGSQPVSVSAHRGKVVIVDFWATWCEPCRDSFPLYQSLSDKYGGELVVLAVSVDEESGGIADFAKATGAKFSIGWDQGQHVAQSYSPPKMPTAYFVDRNGLVRYVHSGFRASDGDIVASHVESLLK